MEKDLEIDMISAVSETLSFKKNNPNSNDEEILKHISKFARTFKNKKTKLGVIAASSKALKIMQRNSQLSDKEVISKVLNQLPLLIDSLK